MDATEKNSIYVLLPKEMFLLNSIKFFIGNYAKDVKKIDRYSFRFPDNIYNYYSKNERMYSLDFVKLLRAYGKGKLDDCAVQELSHIIFLLEASYELSNHDLKDKYYTGFN